MTWYGKVIELRPYDAGEYIYLGAAYALAGQLNEAESWYRKGIECPMGATEEACLNLGLVLRARGNTVDAARYFRQALEIDPEYDEAREALSNWPWLTVRARRLNLNQAFVAKSWHRHRVSNEELKLSRRHSERGRSVTHYSQYQGAGARRGVQLNSKA